MYKPQRSSDEGANGVGEKVHKKEHVAPYSSFYSKQVGAMACLNYFYVSQRSSNFKANKAPNSRDLER